MTYKLSTFVHVTEPGGGGRTGVFGPGDELPDWAVEAITNPDVWEDGKGPPHARGRAAAQPPLASGSGASAVQAAADPAQQSQGEVKRPAKTATKDDWRTYLLGVGRSETELEGLTKDELVGLADQPR